MSDSPYSEIVSERIRSFIRNPETQEELSKVLSSIGKKYRRKLGNYYDIERHSTMQLFLDCLDRIISGKRHWDYNKVRIQAMIINTARSLIGSELEKEIENRKTEVHLEKPRTSEGEEYLTAEELLDYSNTDRESYKSELNTFYDKEYIRMTEKVLKDDKTALEVMEAFMQDNSNISIAKRLKIKVSDVENALKRIRRAGEKVLTIISKQNHRTKEEIRVEILKRE
jgi:hypothetical protein